jgi:hypothetical protein
LYVTRYASSFAFDEEMIKILMSKIMGILSGKKAFFIPLLSADCFSSLYVVALFIKMNILEKSL